MPADLDGVARRPLTMTVSAGSTPAMPWMAARPALGSCSSLARSMAMTEWLAPVSTTNS